MKILNLWLLLFVLVILAGCSDPVQQWGKNSQTEWAGKAEIARIDNEGKQGVAQINSLAAMHESDQQTVRTSIVWSAMPTLLSALGIIVISALAMWWFGRSVNDFVRGIITIRAALPAQTYAYPAFPQQAQALPAQRPGLPVPSTVQEYAITIGILAPDYEYAEGSWWVVETQSNMAYQVPPKLNTPPPRALLTGK